MKYILFAVLIYVLYQFIFNLVVPVYRATHKIRKSFREMQSKMQEHPFDFAQENQQGYSPQSSARDATPREKSGDYIDFEEIK